MLRTNLSSRPFYNDRAVRLGLAVGVVLVAALTAFNALEVVSLTARTRETAARVQEAESATVKYRQQARTVMASMDKAEITAIQQAAREANQLIDRRAFSWTDLFNRFERTLPADVRIMAVEPQIDREGRLLIAATVVSRRVEDLNAFMDQLEEAGGFRDVISRQDDLLESGMLRSIVQGYYAPSADPVPAPEAATGGDAPPGAEGGTVPPAGSLR